MQFVKNILTGGMMICSSFLLVNQTSAQVNSVEFGKNRVQFKKFEWQYFQSPNFNTYFSENGLALGKYVTQLAEQELTSIEKFLEEGLQRRINIVVYNNFDDLQQSNIGIDVEWQNTGGTTKLVNNKMIVYFTGDHNQLKKQVREGIARVLLENQLFGEDIGEFAANKALLDLPQWLTDGYVKYAAENWNATLDDELRSAMLGGSYKNFYHFAFEKPDLAGQAFWFYLAEVYKIENVPYFLYLARVYKNVNAASQRIAKKKFKLLLADFMNYQQEKYYKDMRQRRNVPKGTVTEMKVVSEKKDYFRFSPNPAPRSQTYAVVEYKKGQYSVVLYENYVNRKVLLKYGAKSSVNEINPNYPQIAWDGKGTRIAVVYSHQSKTKLFVYDVVGRFKRVEQDLEMFDQIQDMKYMLDANTLLFSAVKNGQTDIFTYKIEESKVEQITNDIYDDLDATFVTFPSKTGIAFASNRPAPNAPNGDTILPNNRYNIFLVNNWDQKDDYRQITQLTDMKYGDARMPMQYNTYHFTFVSDENGIANRYAGFFSTQRAGLDTLVIIGEDVLRNPPQSEVDSTLELWGKNDIDSVAFVSLTNDSTYVFPLTNYSTGLKETKIAGDLGMVSEVTQQDNFKYLYKLKVNETALKRRNVTAKPTEYMKMIMEAEKLADGEANKYIPIVIDTSRRNVFQTEFDVDTSSPRTPFPLFDAITNEPVLKKSRLYDYKLKFFSDYVVAGFDNTVLVNKFQPYQGGVGPINLANSDPFSGLIRLGTSDLFEDIKFTGGVRVSPFLTFRNTDYLLNFQYLKKRLDWGLTYYRSTEKDPLLFALSPIEMPPPYNQMLPAKLYSNLYQVNVKYPLDRIRSIRMSVGYRNDRYVIKNIPQIPNTIHIEDTATNYSLANIAYVYDNTINVTTNITNGLKYKIFMDWNTNLTSGSKQSGKFTFNLGFDARNYLPIYRNLIWAVRAAGDFSWGSQKVIYYLGGVDGWLFPKFEEINTPDPDASYAFQSLALNLRGFRQNAANGNNALVINSEIRFPVFSTLFNKPINTAFLRNFQLVQFIDLGTAWNGAYDQLKRSVITYVGDENNPITVSAKSGGVGPFTGGYGFGARSTLFGYFLRGDFGWTMDGVFKGKPLFQFAMGVDF